jgi:DNA-binding transcriptional LysR family regulator
LQALTQKEEGSIKVRSGNRDECLLQLMAGEIDFAVIYEIPEEYSPMIHKAFEAVSLGADVLVPVCLKPLRKPIGEGGVPIVGYPSDVFLGGVFDRNIAPRMPAGYTLVTKAETALTLAMLQFVLSGIGMAWLPLSLAASYVDAGQLVRMDHLFPAQDLSISAVRLTEGVQRLDDQIWQSLIELRSLVPVSQPLPNGQTEAV